MLSPKKCNKLVTIMIKKKQTQRYREQAHDCQSVTGVCNGQM